MEDAATVPAAAAKPEEPSPEALAFGHWLFAQDCRFIMAAVDLDQLPEANLPEVAFAGRSNVGKSSLVNALTGRNTLARASNTPGRTQQLIFFDLAEQLRLVDLPGYGYAKAGKGAIRQWTKLTRAFLKGRASLLRVCLLIDARHGIKDSDREVMKELDAAAVSYQIILTKADKCKASAQTEMLEKTTQEAGRHVAAHPEVLLTSAEEGWEIDRLRASLSAFARGAPLSAAPKD